MTPDTAPTHSRFSPSKAHQWSTCTASIGFVEANIAQLPPDRPGPAAIEGTKAHTTAENCVLGRPVPGYATKDMIRFGKAYAEFVHETMGHSGDVFDWGVERRVPLFFYPKERGTVDFFCVNRRGVHVIDFKYGYDPVSSIGNKQMAIYAQSLIEHEMKTGFMWSVMPETKIFITIFQPRIDQPMDTWELTWSELVMFNMDVLTAFQMIQKHSDVSTWGPNKNESFSPAVGLIMPPKDSPLVFAPSDKTCKYCRIAAKCPARGQHLLKDFSPEIDPFLERQYQPAPDAKEMTDNRLAAIYRLRSQVYAWLKDIEEMVEKKVLSGTPMEGLKVVLSKGGHRKWTDQLKAEKILMDLGIPYDDMYEQSFVSPAQAEKITKDKKGQKIVELFRLMIKPPGSPIVVPENDPRPEHAPDVLADFREKDVDPFS